MSTDKDARADGGLQSPHVGERLARVEETQQHLSTRLEDRTDVIETKIDHVAESVDNLEDSHTVVARRNAKLWVGVQALKWGGPVLAGSGILLWSVQSVVG